MSGYFEWTASGLNRFTRDVLVRLGYPVTTENLIALQAIHQAEGDDENNNNAAWNPWNSTLEMPGSTDFNAVPVQNYVSRAQGITASATTIKSRERGYGAIRRALKAGTSAQAVVQAWENSAWGTGGLGTDVLTGWKITT